MPGLCCSVWDLFSCCMPALGACSLNHWATREVPPKWAKTLNRYFPKENVQMANKHLKICSIAPIFMEMQIKTTVR